MSRYSTVITGRGVRFSKHRMSVYINQGQGYKSPYAGWLVFLLFDRNIECPKVEKFVRKL